VLLAIYQVNTIIYYLILHFFFILIFIVCATCTTTDHGPAGHEFSPLNDAGKSIKEEEEEKKNLLLYISIQ
jgi:hypothetical protein